MGYSASVIQPGDMHAARILDRARPDLRPAIRAALAALRAPAPSEAPGGTLLGHLLARGLVTRDEAERTWAEVTRLRRRRLLALWAGLAVEAGAPAPEVAARLGPPGDPHDPAEAGAALVARGALAPDAEARCRFQAKLAFDHEQEAWLRSALERLDAADASADAAPALEPPAAAAVPVAAEATAVLDRAAQGLAPAAAAPPPFAIPEWVDTAAPLVGTTVGPYRLRGKVGEGAMATVWLADREADPRPYALKLVPAGASDEVLARFRREILANGFFSHEHVIDVFDAGATPDGRPYLAMEFFDGSDLEAVLAAEGSISLRQALKLGRQVAGALAAAHEARIVHRDVKPANILVSQDGNTAKLTDFGLALIGDLGDFKDKVFESDEGGVTGTPEYLSPEQALRDPVGPPADLYALGLVLYRCLAGRSPFEARSPGAWVQAHLRQAPRPLREAAPGAPWPPALEDLLGRLLAKEPAARPRSAGEVAAALEDLLLGLERTRRHLRPFRRGF